MKHKKVDAEEAFRQLAKRRGVSVEEVRKQIELAIQVGLMNPDPNVQLYWTKIPHKGSVPTPEEVVVFLAEEVLRNQ